jgi:hypothetical protein
MHVSTKGICRLVCWVKTRCSIVSLRETEKMVGEETCTQRHKYAQTCIMTPQPFLSSLAKQDRKDVRQWGTYIFTCYTSHSPRLGSWCSLLMVFFRIKSMCEFVGRCQRFGEACCIHLRGVTQKNIIRIVIAVEFLNLTPCSFVTNTNSTARRRSLLTVFKYTAATSINILTDNKHREFYFIVHSNFEYDTAFLRKWNGSTWPVKHDVRL